METSTITRRIVKRADFRKWAWWELPGLLRIYVALVPLTTLALALFAASRTTWHATDLGKFCLLLGAGLISVAATSRIAYLKGGMTRDFITVWVLPIAILLPPVYAMMAPLPLYMLTQWRVHRGVIYRWVFTIGAIGLGYGGASLLFRAFPVSFAGGAIGTSMHAITWALAVGACEIVGGRGHNSLILLAVKLSDPSVRLSNLEFNREALQADLAEFDLGVLITVVVAVSPVLVVFGVPTVLLARRFMMHEQLLAQSRIDTKTGLLNSSTWETEAAIEVARALRTQAPLAVALIDIDHFKAVNDTHGHLVGDKVLRAVTGAIREQLRTYDLAGRFGGEEFVILLPNAGEADAISIAERLRKHVQAMEIAVSDDESGPCVTLTISVGVAALNSHTSELIELTSAADAAMYVAKQSGRNRTHVAQHPAGSAAEGRLSPEQASGDSTEPVSATAAAVPTVVRTTA
jgi:diguanylate cyclase (GGDEF)-like protein